ncbi:MAG TPA: hypothetical protein VKA60_19220 [Blastocatellia bacterium]|nr:hypothetical protein [Blastocatellia bacterium]
MSACGKTLAALLLLLALIINAGDGHTTASAKADLKRIQFQIVTVETRGGQRHVLSNATVEGPPGTDFQINLESERFKMDARFLTDLVNNDALQVRAKLQTRRLYGRSANDLPLYEEDAQSHTLRLSFEEAIILLPFGRAGDDRFSIEITPALTNQPAYLATGEVTPPAIQIDDRQLRGVISIQAQAAPHEYDAQVSLLRDGREVARGNARLMREEAGEVVLRPLDPTSAELTDRPLAVNLTLAPFAQDCAADRLKVSFDLYRVGKPGADQRAMIATDWQGVARAGADLRYDLSNDAAGLAAGKLELKFNLKPADR